MAKKKKRKNKKNNQSVKTFVEKNDTRSLKSKNKENPQNHSAKKEHVAKKHKKNEPTERQGCSCEHCQDSNEVRLDWLLNLSAFFFIGGGIVVIYGGWFIARTYLPQINPAFITKHNDVVIKGLLYGTLLFETGIFFKLYGILHKLSLKNHKKEEFTGEWFLKLAIVLLVGASCVILTTGFVKQHLFNFHMAADSAFAMNYLGSYVKRCILSGSFFLLLAIFTQTYMLLNRLSVDD